MEDSRYSTTIKSGGGAPSQEIRGIGVSRWEIVMGFLVVKKEQRKCCLKLNRLK